MRNKRIAVTPTIGTDAYTASDVVGGLMTFAVSTEQGHRSGQIRSVLVTDAAAQSEPYTFYIFRAAPSTIADDAAFAPTIADLKKLVAVLDITAANYTTVNSLDYNIIGGATTALEIEFDTDDGNLYAYAVANASTPDYDAATDLTFTLLVRMY